MKYLKLFLSILILLFTLTTTYAQDCFPDDPDCLPENPNIGPGAQGIPIDDYAPILIIIGITVAGTVLYRKQQKQVN